MILANRLSSIVKENDISCVIANAENSAGGSGLTPQIYTKLLRYGVNMVTLGDHTYRKREIIQVLESENNIARPANLSEYCSGSGVAYYQTSAGPTVAVISLIGRVFMKPADCPYNAVDRLIPRVKQKAEVVIIDMHAEATSEKIALGHHLDGKVSGIFGTHTHVQTADETILPNGTAYITDVGMTGAHDSVLGRNKENVLKSFRTQMPYTYAVATGDVRVSGVIMTIDSNSQKAESIRRISISDQVDNQNYDSDDGQPGHYDNL